MSNAKQTGAKLPGFWGPFFTPSIEELHIEVYGARGKSFSGFILNSLGQKIRDFVGTRRPTTSDNYVWFWSMDFRMGNGKVAILFPWGQDFELYDGTSADRHTALYISRSADVDTADAIARKVLSSIRGKPECRNRRLVTITT